jgi:hypothetical protein
MNIGLTIETGSTVYFGNEHSSIETYPVFSMRNTRVMFSYSVNRGNYGFSFSPEFRIRNGGSNSTNANNHIFITGNVWAMLADSNVRVMAGRVGGAWTGWGLMAGNDMGAWTSLGLRVEVMPADLVPGLNVGFLLRPSFRIGNYFDPDDEDRQVSASHWNRLAYALGNTTFGARYAPAGGPVQVAVGAELYSRHEPRISFGQWGIGAIDVPWFGTMQGGSTGYLWPAARGLQGTFPETDPFHGDLSELGVSAWLSSNLILVDNMTIQVGGRAFHLDDFSDSGHVWLNQRVRYALDDALTVGMDLQQLLLTGNLGRTNFADNDDSGPVDIALKFSPHAFYDISDKMSLGVYVPFSIAPGWSSESYNALAVAFNPWLSYDLGRGFNIVLDYELNWNNQLGLPGTNSEIGNWFTLLFTFRL